MYAIWIGVLMPRNDNGRTRRGARGGRSRTVRVAVVLMALLSLVAAGCGGGGGAGDETGGVNGAAAGGAPQGVTEDTITVGALGPLTGPSSFIGVGVRDGLRLAFQEINEGGGINGRDLELVFEQAAGSAESVSAAKRLVEQEGVYALVLGGGSTAAAAAADYVREQDIPTYSVIAATPAIREPFARNVFHGVALDARNNAEATVEMLQESQASPEKVAVVSGRFEYAAASRDQVVPLLEEAGIEVVAEQNFDLGDEDFSAQIAALKDSDAEAVLNITFAVEGQRFLNQAHSLGLELPIFIDQAAVVAEILQAGEAAAGVRGTSNIPYFFGSENEAMQEFQDRFRAAYPDAGVELAPDLPKTRPSQPDVIGYGDGYVLANVIREAGDDLSWGNLIATWEQQEEVLPSDLGGVDVIFPESFSPDNHQGNSRLAIMQIANNTFERIGLVEIPRDELHG